MSIIHDALKKTQQNLKPPADLKASQPISPQNPKQKRTIQHTIILMIVGFCSIALICTAAWFIYQHFQKPLTKTKIVHKKIIYKLVHKTPAPIIKALTPQPPKPLAQIIINQTTPPTLKPITSPDPITLDIHGIMSDPSGNVALINDEVYQEGDVIGGAKIVKINLDDITVSINGTSETIHVKD